MAGSNYVYTITVDAGQAGNAVQGLESRVQSATGKVSGLQSAFDRIGRAAFAFVNIAESMDRMTASIDSLAGPGMALNAQMQELSAITGVTGKGLREIEGYARDAARTFGGSAAESVEAYKLVLSQLGPEIAQVPEALASMGDSIKTTSKLMGNDTAAAASVLTTAMNQYQVSLADPAKASEEMARMMNVMAAAGQAGSAELPAIAAALEQAGMVAKTAGVSFEETNAAIQMLDKAGKKGSEGGVALRNVMTTLMQGRFLPADVQEELAAAGVSVDTLTDQSLSLAERMRELSPLMNDQALMSKMFGRENVAAALALMSSLGPMEELTVAISGSNSAYEQAGVIMDSDMEKMSRFQARIDNFKISLYEAFSGMVPAVKGLGSAMQTAAGLASGMTALQAMMETRLGAAIRKRAAATWQAVTATAAGTGSLGVFSVTAGIARAACHGLAAGFKAIGKAIYSIPIIGWIAAGISLVVKGIQLLWEKSEGFRQVVFGVWEWIKTMFQNVGILFGNIWNNGIKPAVDGIAGAFRTAFEAVAGVFSRIAGGIRNAFNAIRNMATSVIRSVYEKFAWLIDPVVRVFRRVADGVRDMFDGIIDWIGRTFEGVKSWLKGQGFQSGAEAWERGRQKGAESWAKDNPDTGKAVPPPMPQDAVLPEAGGIVPMSGIQSATSSPAGTATTVDLNNVRGGGNYEAIVSRLSPKRFAGLGGGSMQPKPVAGPMAAGTDNRKEMPSFLEVVPQQEISLLRQIAQHVGQIAAGITIAALPVTPVQAVTKERTRFEKFCERVEINMPQGTTDSQVDYLLAELMRRINDAVE